MKNVAQKNRTVYVVLDIEGHQHCTTYSYSEAVMIASAIHGSWREC